MRNQSCSRNQALHRIPTIAAAAALFALAPIGGASAYTLTTLHTFCTEQNPPCGDGEGSVGGLLRDQSGNLYGTAIFGGKYNEGLVFKLVPNGDTYKEYILHNFCARANCTDGAGPGADLIMDVDGNLYGTTYYGGKYGGGVVFKLTHQAGGWSLGVIHAFCGSGCANGTFAVTGLAYPGQASGAPWDEFSPLFGATAGGGSHDRGAVYKLIEDGSFWNYEVIHSFSENGPHISDYPGPLLVDSAGNLLGVTQIGGKYDNGVLYRLAAGTWKETILHNFCAEANCADGNYAEGRLAMDAAGTLFGVTATGGSGSYCKRHNGCGVAFEHPSGGPYTVIYNFCTQHHCADGDIPDAGMIMDAGGNLYGTTGGGGMQRHGTVFELTPGAQWTENVLYDFCSEINCNDGEGPYEEPLIMDSAGNFYGTTYNGGAHSAGTVFELTP